MNFLSLKGSNGPAASDFQFTYADILGNIQTYPILMDKNSEGYMFIFPAHLGHSVHPFYDCYDETNFYCFTTFFGI